MLTPGGQKMSAAMTNCGEVGWVTDRKGYRYDRVDPETERPWPPLPESFARLAELAAAQAGFSGFRPDVCLINRYEPGARMSLHQDRDERDFSAPIVSVSLGLEATFPVWRFEALRPATSPAAGAWRCTRLGRSEAPRLSRNRPGGRWVPPDRRSDALESDNANGALAPRPRRSTTRRSSRKWRVRRRMRQYTS